MASADVVSNEGCQHRQTVPASDESRIMRIGTRLRRRSGLVFAALSLSAGCGSSGDYSPFDPNLSKALVEGAEAATDVQRVRVYRFPRDAGWPDARALEVQRPDLEIEGQAAEARELLRALTTWTASGATSPYHSVVVVVVDMRDGRRGYVHCSVSPSTAFVAPLVPRDGWDVSGFPSLEVGHWLRRNLDRRRSQAEVAHVESSSCRD